jgi:hypothetical protein
MAAKRKQKMLSTNKVKVIGMTDSVWDIADEDDKSRVSHVDNCLVFYEIPLRSEVVGATGRSRGRGVAAASIKIGNSALYDKFINIPTPFFAEIDIQKVSNGRKESEEVVGFRPLESYKEEKPLKAAS